MSELSAGFQVLLILGIIFGIGLFLGIIFLCAQHYVPWYKVTDVDYQEDRYDKIYLTMENSRLGHIARGEEDTYWEARHKAQSKLWKMGRKDRQRRKVERKAAKLKGEAVPSFKTRVFSRRELKKISKGQF